MWYINQSLVGNLLGNPALREALKLVLVGALIQTATRFASWLANKLAQSVTVTMRVEEKDDAHAWVSAWLESEIEKQSQSRWIFSNLAHLVNPYSAHPPRDFRITTKRTLMKDYFDKYHRTELDEHNDRHGTDALRIKIMPVYENTHSVRFKGSMIRITTSRESSGALMRAPREWIALSAISSSRDILEHLISTARRDFESLDKSKIVLYMASGDDRGQWQRVGVKQKRPINTVILPTGIKGRVLADAKDFIAQQTWYNTRGIPHRRGYLLCGVPGSGKTSLVSAIASELGLNIYIVSLGQSSLDDRTLNELIVNCPARCVLLMEDIDCALRSRQQTAEGGDAGQETPANTEAAKSATPGETTKKEDNGCRVTLSGLLNSIDGIAAQEGRIFFATTNHVKRLDPALSRPGRCDVWVEFRNASTSQAKQLFLHIFPPRKDVDPPPALDEKKDIDLAIDIQVDMRTDLEKVRKTYYPSSTRIEMLADTFANIIPDAEHSIASLQGFLLGYKDDPETAVEAVQEWVANGAQPMVRGVWTSEPREGEELWNGRSIGRPAHVDRGTLLKT